MTDKERRRKYRVPCHDVWLTITVGDQTGITPSQKLPSRQVKVDNLSDSGICLLATDSFELGQLIIFADPTLPPQGEVVWTCQTKLGCKAGVQFKTL